MKTVEQVLEGVTAGGKWEEVSDEMVGYSVELGAVGVAAKIAGFYAQQYATNDPKSRQRIGQPEAFANAAYAARACSTWPELVKALEGLTKFSVELCEDTGISANYPSIQAARAALEAALKD